MNTTPDSCSPFNHADSNQLLLQQLNSIEAMIKAPPINGEKLNASLQLIWKGLEESSAAKPDSDLLEKLRSGMQKLDQACSPKILLIQQIYDKATSQLQERRASEQTPPYSYLSMLASGIYKTMVYVPSSFYSYTYGRSSPPTQEGHSKSEIEKFRLGLKEIAKGFENDSISLDFYSKGLKQLCDLTPLQKMAGECIYLLQTHGECEDEKIANLYREFLDKLRVALKSEEFIKEIKKLTEPQNKETKLKERTEIDFSAICLLLICKYRFAEVNIHQLSEKMVSSMVSKGLGMPKSRSAQELLRLPMDEQMKAVAKAPKEWTSFQWFLNWVPGALNIFLDPHRWSNMPYKLGDIELKQADGTTKNIRFLRTGTPTMQRTRELGVTSWQGTAQIVPEFEHFLTSITFDGNKKLLFLSLQDEQPRKIGTENTRNKSLKDLRERHINNFFLGILAQDNDFYQQSGEYANIFNSDIFKNKFMLMLQGENIGYWFPKAWLEDKNFKEGLKRIIDEIHEDVFAKDTILSVQERQDFIEIFYAPLALYLLQYTSADYFCFCCKDSKDRAIKCFSILFTYMLIILDQDENADDQAFVKVVTNAAALHVSQSAMNVRKIRLLSAIKRLCQPEVKARLRKRIKESGIKSLKFAK